MRIKRKPSPVLEAYRVGSEEPVPAWVAEEHIRRQMDGSFVVKNASGELRAVRGDVVVRRKPGDCYVVTGHDFDELFEVEAE